MILQRKLNQYRINVNVEPEDDRILKYKAKVECPVDKCNNSYEAANKMIGRAATQAIDILRIHIRKTHEKA